jgi:hypothetical protein
MSDGLFATRDEIEQPADFGESERDQAPTDGWSGFRFALPIVLVIGIVYPRGVIAPPFFDVCAVTARKVWASMAKVMCRCHASQVRT